jgi:hypothetical protein
MMLSRLLKNFFSLAVLESTNVLSLEAESSEANSDMPIKIFYKSANSKINPKQSSPLNILFGYDDITERFEYTIKKRFENAENLKPVYDLYFSALHSSSMYLDHKFLNFIQALEAYHRRVIGGNDLPDKAHEKRISEILGSTLDHHKKWLQEELRYSRKKSRH